MKTIKEPGFVECFLNNHLGNTKLWLKLRSRTDMMAVRQLPNAITVLRLPAFIPAYMGASAYIRGRWVCGTILILLSGFMTSFDMVDGWAARNLDKASIADGNPPVISKFGQLIDPLADKLVGVTLLLRFTEVMRHGSKTLITGLFDTASFLTDLMVGLEILLVIISIIGVLMHWQSDGANKWGKRKFACECGALTLGYLGWAGLHQIEPNQVIYWFCALVAGAIIFAVLSIISHIQAQFSAKVSLS